MKEHMIKLKDEIMGVIIQRQFAELSSSPTTEIIHILYSGLYSKDDISEALSLLERENKIKIIDMKWHPVVKEDNQFNSMVHEKDVINDKKICNAIDSFHNRYNRKRNPTEWEVLDSYYMLYGYVDKKELIKRIKSLARKGEIVKWTRSWKYKLCQKKE